MKHECYYDSLIKDFKKDFYGNGKNGIKADVLILKTRLNFLFLGVGFIIAQLSAILIMLIRA